MQHIYRYYPFLLKTNHKFICLNFLDDNGQIIHAGSNCICIKCGYEIVYFPYNAIDKRLQPKFPETDKVPHFFNKLSDIIECGAYEMNEALK